MNRTVDRKLRLGSFRHFLDCTCQCNERRRALEQALNPMQRSTTGVSRDDSAPAESSTATGPPIWPHVKRSFSVPTPGNPKVEALVPFHEFTGFGHPSRNDSSFGAPGDIYIGLTPGEHTVYGKTSSTEWKIWPGPLMVLNGLCHPAYPEDILYAKEFGRFTELGWFQKRICKNNFKDSTHEIICRVLSSRSSRVRGPGKKRKRAGESEPQKTKYVAKRRKNGELDQHPQAKEVSASDADNTQLREQTQSGPPLQPSAQLDSLSLPTTVDTLNHDDMAGYKDDTHSSSNPMSPANVESEIREQATISNPHPQGRPDESENETPNRVDIVTSDVPSPISKPHSQEAPASLAGCPLTPDTLDRTREGEADLTDTLTYTYTDSHCRVTSDDNVNRRQNISQSTTVTENAKGVNGGSDVTNEPCTPTEQSCPVPAEITIKTEDLAIDSMQHPPFESGQVNLETLFSEENSLFQDWMRVVFHRLETNNTVMCRLCLAESSSKISKFNIGATGLDVLNKHCQEDHSDMCGILLELDSEQLVELEASLIDVQ